MPRLKLSATEGIKTCGGESAVTPCLNVDEQRHGAGAITFAHAASASPAPKMPLRTVEEVAELKRMWDELDPAEKQQLELNVREKDDRVLQVTREFIHLQQETQKKIMAALPSPSCRLHNTIHRDSPLTRSNALLLGMCALFITLALCMGVCWSIDADNCPLFATADGHMLFDWLMASGSTPARIFGSRETGQDVACGRRNEQAGGGAADLGRGSQIKAWIF